MWNIILSVLAGSVSKWRETQAAEAAVGRVVPAAGAGKAAGRPTTDGPNDDDDGKVALL